MIHRSSQPLRLWFLVWDVAVTILAWLGAYWVRFNSGLIPLFHPDHTAFSVCVRAVPLLVLVALVCFRHASMYEVHRLTRLREEAASVGKGVALTALLTASIAFALRYQYESRIAYALFATFSLVGILTARRLTWFAVGRLRAKGYNQSHALIIGTGRLARRTAQSLADASWSGIQTVAYVEDDPATHQKHSDIPVVGPIADLPALVDKHHIEHVFISLPMNRYADVRRVFDLLSQTLVDVRLVADVPALTTLTFTTSSVHGMTFIGLRESPYHGVNVVVKRAMDIFLSVVALILLSPLLLLIAALVKRSSSGPVFYRQVRCSLNGDSFPMLKFRSMRSDAEAAGPKMAEKGDPRVTRVGRFLRATNLDELPQLFNVLWGQMSLVGPRPERPVFVEQFQKSIPNYMSRHAVKCGMTGWAQVNGWRGNSSLRRRVQFDLYYITHWNPLFDLRIMALTVVTMVFKKQKHAY